VVVYEENSDEHEAGMMGAEFKQGLDAYAIVATRGLLFE